MCGQLLNFFGNQPVTQNNYLSLLNKVRSQ